MPFALRSLLLSVFCYLLSAFAPPSLAADGPPPLPPAPTRADIDRSIQRGLDFLLKIQNKDGSWGSAHQTKNLNIYAPVPGAHLAFRAAVTGMAVSAFVETGAADRSEVERKAFQRGSAWLLKNLPQVRRATADTMYNVWTHAYAIQALVHLYQRETADTKRRNQIRDLVLAQLDFLRRYESVDGGWGYYDFRVGAKRPATDSTSFVTATILVVFDQARAAGIPVPEDMRRRAFDSIRRQQKKDFSYEYGEYLKWRPMLPINRPGGSLGRSQACNLALRLWGDTDITDQVMITWLDRLVARNGWLDIGRKRPIPHESWFQVAGYFFYYGHYYAALCIDLLPSDQRPKYFAQLAGILLPLQEKDGSWWDYPLYNYHQQYGTAYGLMTLARCRSAF